MEYLNILFNSVLYLELITAIIGSFFLRKFKRASISYFVGLLWFTVILDFMGNYIFKQGFNNMGVYNFSDFVRYNFLIYFFSSLENERNKNYIGIIALLIFNTAIVLNWFWVKGILIQNLSYAFSLGSIFLLITIFLFFNRILNTEVVVNIRNHLLVWLGVGILFYTVVEIPLVAITNYFEEIGNGHTYLLLIRVFANFIMYFSFIAGFIIAKEE